MITIIKVNGRHYVTCGCGVKNQVVSSVFGKCINCESSLRFATSLTEQPSCRIGVLSYYKYGSADYDMVEHGRETRAIYHKMTG